MEVNFDHSLNINQVNASQTSVTGGNNLSSSGNVSVFANNDEAIKQLCEKLQITKEQLEIIYQKYPDFLSFDPAKQAEIVKTDFISSVNGKVSTDAEDPKNGAETNAIGNNTATDGIDEGASTTYFNHKEYSKLSVQEKANVYALELAKNKFMFAADGTRKSLEEWNALTDEQKNNLVKQELNNLIKDNSNKLYDSKDISLYFDNKMTQLQASNYIEENIDIFSKGKAGHISESIHDYLFDLSSEGDNLSRTQNTYLESQSILSKAVIQACKKNGDTTYVDGVDYNLSENEIAAKFDKGGVLDGTSRVKVQLEYLQDKQDKGIKLTESEQEVLNRLNKLVNTPEGQAFLDAVKYKSLHPDAQVNYGRLDALKNSEFGKHFESAVNKDDKAFVVQAYLKKASKNLSPEEKAKLINELTIELMYDNDNAELIADVHSDAVSNADDKTQTVLAENTEEGLAELNALNADSFEENGLSTLANTHEKMIEEDAERAEMLASATMDNLSNKKLAVVSDIYSSSKSVAIQRKHSDRALGLKVDNKQDIDIQRAMLENVAKNSNLEVRKETGTRLDEAHKDNQLPLTKQFISDKEVAKAMNADGTFTRYDKDNKTDAFRMFRTRFEQDDFSKNEAVNQLNLLADNIKKVKEADIQLEMHNDIMQSKYSEVQEHAAGNIKDYDPTVQSKALESVYATGNEKAIDAAVESISDAKSLDVIQQNFNKVVTESLVKTVDNSSDALNTIDTASKDDVSIKEKVAAGTRLTTQEFASLTPSEKREYIANLFKNLSPNEKIKLINSISNQSTKRSIYKMIARTNGDLFNRMINDADVAKTILDMNLSAEINNKILTVVNRKKYSTNAFADLSKDYNKDTQNNLSYSTNPYGGFDTKEIFKKDKTGNLLG